MTPQRNEGESELEFLRRKEKSFGLWQQDALERIHRIEAENRQLIADNERRCQALNATRNILNATAQMILTENFDMPMDTFAKDYAPFINVMAHHGIDPAVKRLKKREKSA